MISADAERITEVTSTIDTDTSMTEVTIAPDTERITEVTTDTERTTEVTNVTDTEWIT